jgi:cobalt/nickel transport system permease protein
LIAGVAWTSSFNPGHGPGWAAVVARSGLCLATMLVLGAVVPFGTLPGVLRRWRVPALLVTTLTLLHRYLFVLGEEMSRMNKARTSRMLKSTRRARWGQPASVIGVLFVRASERAERVYLAMCSRGWK